MREGYRQGPSTRTVTESCADCGSEFEKSPRATAQRRCATCTPIHKARVDKARNDRNNALKCEKWRAETAAKRSTTEEA